jgi:acetate kinase
MSVLVFNAGSSTLKFGVFTDDASAEVAGGTFDWRHEPGRIDVAFRRPAGTEDQQHVPGRGAADAMPHLLQLLQSAGLRDGVRACGHRVVHGGERFRQSVRIDDAVQEHLFELVELAPLHNPQALAGIEAAEDAFPHVPHVAVFDTAFFADLPPALFLYPVPYDWYTSWRIRRFGFHGISHQYCTGRAGELLGRPDARLVICHLGNGCSASAVRAGDALACTMGFTPLEGLMMGTRSGSIDPGILLYLLRKGLRTVEQLENALQKESGLLGVSGVASDFRAVEEAAHAGDDRAALALRMFADRIRAAVGALATLLGGIDAVVFTAGIGEHSARLRREVCRGLEFIGLEIDETANAAGRPDSDVAMPGSRGRILVLETREDLLIARETIRIA